MVLSSCVAMSQPKKEVANARVIQSQLTAQNDLDHSHRTKGSPAGAQFKSPPPDQGVSKGSVSRQAIPGNIVNRTTRMFENDQLGNSEGDRPPTNKERPASMFSTSSKAIAPLRPPPIAKKPNLPDVRPKVMGPKPKLPQDKEQSPIRRISLDSSNTHSKSVLTTSKVFEDAKGTSQAGSKEGSPTHSVKSSQSSDSGDGCSIMDRIKQLQTPPQSTEPETVTYAKVDMSKKKKNRQPEISVCIDKSSEQETKGHVLSAEQVEESGGEYALLKMTVPDAKKLDSNQPISPLSQNPGAPPQPPRKPPRTFAHDDYVVQKQMKRQKKQAVKEARKANVIQEVENSSQSNKAQATVELSESNQAEKPRTDSSGYEIVDFEESGNRGSLFVVEPHKKPSFKYQTIHRIPNGDNSKQLKRPGERPPPPPRPPPPSPRSSLSGYTPDPQRWEQPFVRVNQHNEKLPKTAFLAKGKVSNPSYEADWNIIRIKTPKSKDEDQSNSSLKRCKSDECLYAEPTIRRVIYPETFDEPVYQDPADAIKPPNHYVQIDEEGYAVPDHKHPPPTRPHQNLQRMSDSAVSENTVIDGKSGHKKGNYEKHTPNYTPGVRLRPQIKRKPHVQAKLSEAYSVLRVNLLPDTDQTDKNPTQDDSDNEVDPTEHQERLLYVSTVKLRLSMAVQQSPRRTPQELSIKLFNYAAIIGLEKIEDSNKYETKVIFQFPYQSNKEMETISHFCFPDLGIWRPVTRYKSETFSFVLTDEHANRQYGYCMRTLPPGSGNRLPLVFCIVSSLDAFMFYEKLLHEIKQKNKISEDHAEMLIKAAYATPLPDLDKEAWISSIGADEKKETIFLKRPPDTRQENVSFSTLLTNLSVDNLLKVFASVLLERKIIFVAQHLSTLTSCIHAVCALLYPFVWPHPFVPVLPENMIEVCQSPTPIIVGILTLFQPKVVELNLDQVLMIDLDHNTLMMSHGDESRIIPKKLQRALKLALRDDGETSISRDILVMESFLRFFVETIGHYTEYTCTQMDGERIFQKNSFMMSVTSKSIRMFLEWFVETQMFEVFISDRLEDGESTGIFETRIMEYREEMLSTPTMKQNMKQMGRKVKNFFVESGDRIKKKFTNNVFI